MAMSESEARDENVKSLRAIACCAQMVTLVLVRQFSHTNVGVSHARDLEEKLEIFSVGLLDE